MFPPPPRRGVVYAKPVGTVRPMQANDLSVTGGGIMMTRPGQVQGRAGNFPADALAKRGVSVQQITVPKGGCLYSRSRCLKVGVCTLDHGAYRWVSILQITVLITLPTHSASRKYSYPLVNTKCFTITQKLPGKIMKLVQTKQ